MMSNILIQKKKQIEIMQLEMNVLKLETRLLELDEEQGQTKKNITVQKERLKELKQEVNKK